MSGKLFKAILLMLVLSVACLITAPVFSGEHPWDSDVVGKDSTIVVDPGSLGLDTTIDTSGVTPPQSGGDGDSPSSLFNDWISVVIRVLSTLSGTF